MRKSELFILLTLLIFLTTSISFAEQTLVVNLDPPSSSSPGDSKTDFILKHQPVKSAQKRAVIKQPSSQGMSAAGKQIVIGRVGVITTIKARIQRSPSSKAPDLYSCKKDTPLAIVSEVTGWYGVLMADSSTGWVEKSSVNLLDYDVMGTQTVGSAGGYSAVGSSIVNNSLRYLGIPYRWGGTSVNGIDCSGFVRSVFAAHGISLPRVARDQARVGQEVKWEELQPGDRLYFACKGGPVDHAGIYMGNGLFIHSSTGRGGVAIDKIMTPLFVKSLVAARR
ncbi:MAG: C40 family peptidase [Armatimonadota bacterium]